MTNEDLLKVVQRGEMSAFLIGQIHGKLHNILQFPSPATQTDLRHELHNLFNYITQETYNLYYQPKEKDENPTN